LILNEYETLKQRN